MLSGYTTHEGRFQSHDGLDLFFQDFTPTQSPPKGLFLITHGHGEHTDSYERLMNGIGSMGWAYVLWDQRGHGRSPGKRGFAKSFFDYTLDFKIFLNFVTQELVEFKNLPMVLISHSMGGLVTQYSLIDLTQTKALPKNLVAQVVSSPLMGVATQVPLYKKVAAEIALRVYPEITLWNELYPHQFTRDEEVLKSYDKDPLRHDKMSPGVYLDFLKALKKVHDEAHYINLPTLFQLAEKDSVVSTPQAQEVFAKLGSQIKKEIIYKGAYHEIYNDLDRIQAYGDLMSFVKPFGKSL